MKTSFTVMFDRGNKTHVVAGVTSIVPNLNGFLFFTEDRVNYQVESCDLIDGGMSSISFEYNYTDEDFEDFARLSSYVFHDHRAVEKSKAESVSTMGKFYKNNTHLGGTARPRTRT